jgi:hypothetical protein
MMASVTNCSRHGLGTVQKRFCSGPTTQMSSIHAIRAKKWKTNPFLAEWLANAFDYYQTREGKRAFEVW